MLKLHNRQKGYNNLKTRFFWNGKKETTDLCNWSIGCHVTGCQLQRVRRKKITNIKSLHTTIHASYFSIGNIKCFERHKKNSNWSYTVNSNINRLAKRYLIDTFTVLDFGTGAWRLAIIDKWTIIFMESYFDSLVDLYIP